MKFEYAYERMLEGKKVRRKGWGGYWYVGDYGGVVIHLKEGYELKNVSDNLRVTIENVMADDWEEVA